VALTADNNYHSLVGYLLNFHTYSIHLLVILGNDDDEDYDDEPMLNHTSGEKHISRQCTKRRISSESTARSQSVSYHHECFLCKLSVVFSACCV